MTPDPRLSRPPTHDRLVSLAARLSSLENLLSEMSSGASSRRYDRPLHRNHGGTADVLSLLSLIDTISKRLSQLGTTLDRVESALLELEQVRSHECQNQSRR